MAKFKAGERVVFLDKENTFIPSKFHAASWGDNHLVMHLNARDENGKIKPITGAILRIAHTDKNGNVTYSFQPDGWPQEAAFAGFQMDEEYFSALLDGLYLPGTITDKSGNKPKGES